MRAISTLPHAVEKKREARTSPGITPVHRVQVVCWGRSLQFVFFRAVFETHLPRGGAEVVAPSAAECFPHLARVEVWLNQVAECAVQLRACALEHFGYVCPSESERRLVRASLLTSAQDVAIQ